LTSLRATLLLGLLFLCGLACAGEVYKSIGADGKVQYGDRKPAAGQVEILRLPDLPASPLPASVLRYREDLQRSLAERLAAKPPPQGGVRLFSADWCGYCQQAKAYLAEKGIRYREYNIDTEAGGRAFAETGSQGGVPLLQWQGRQITGFSRAGYDALFKSAKSAH
jgi:glutaredoxin